MSEMAWIEAHLKAVKQDTEIVSETLFAQEALEKHAFETFMAQYLAGVKACYESGDSDVVMIGSVVEVEDLEDGDIFEIQIVSPSDDEEDEFMMAASYLSSVGKALLLRKTGEEVQVKTPQSNMAYRIKQIKQIKQLPASSS